jgi:hypothetical protein
MAHWGFLDDRTGDYCLFDAMFLGFHETSRVRSGWRSWVFCAFLCVLPHHTLQYSWRACTCEICRKPGGVDPKGLEHRYLQGQICILFHATLTPSTTTPAPPALPGTGTSHFSGFLLYIGHGGMTARPVINVPPRPTQRVRWMSW